MLKFGVYVQKLVCTQLEKEERYDVSINILDLLKITNMSICLSSQKYDQIAIKTTAQSWKSLCPNVINKF